jgi:hypothetical protein
MNTEFIEVQETTGLLSADLQDTAGTSAYGTGLIRFLTPVAFLSPMSFIIVLK